MLSYKVKRDKRSKKIVALENEVIVYKMQPKFKKRNNLLEVKELLVVDGDLKSSMCKRKFDIVFKRLTSIVYSLLDDCEDDGDIVIALNEIEHAKRVILDEYMLYLAKSDIKLMLKKLNFLEAKIKEYLVSYNNYYEHGKSR